MFKPKYKNKKQRLSFKIDAEIINNRESDLVTGLKGKALDEVTLFIDDASVDAAPSLASLQSSLKSLQGKADNTWSQLCDYLSNADWGRYSSVCLSN